jgi:short-subunit dehydrogenase
MELKGKTALITGSSRGVGQQIALGLANLGCNVILHARTKQSCSSTQQMIMDKGVKVFVIYGDLIEEKNVLDVIDQVKNLNIDVDILYNNAAIMKDYREDIWSHSWDEWMDTMKVNVFAMYTLCSAFIPKMVENNFGRVINLTSGIQFVPELAPYGTSKWAVRKLTEELASKFNNSNVLINSLDPGWLKTDMGSQDAPNDVTDVLPGALEPALLEKGGMNGQVFRALEYR